MKKGFTLIELLAVVIVLAVIAVIATPIVLDVVSDVRAEANRQTAYGIMDAAKLYYTDSMLEPDKQANIGTGSNIYDLIQVQGDKPEEGQLYINEEGKISLSVTIGNKCYVKGYETDLQEYESTSDECTAFVGDDEIAPVITYEVTGTEGNGGWYISSLYIKLSVIDTNSGVDYYKWCTGVDCIPENRETSNKTLIFDTNNEVTVCAQAFDNAGNASDKTCTDTYKIDVTNPVTGNLTINGSEVTQEETLNTWYTEDLTLGVTNGTDNISDILESGHNTTTIDITEIKEDTDGTTVTVTTIDKAGNVSTKEYTIKVDKTLPSVEITEPTIDGQNGWYVSDVTVTAKVEDTNFAKLKWCEGNNCNPETEISNNEITKTFTTDTEGTQLCVIGVDVSGNETEKTCSSVIKIDKTQPYFIGISDITVNVGETVDLTTGVEVNDVTSKIDGTYDYSPKTIDTSKTDEFTVTYTVYDKAGNEKSITRKITVDSSAPTITFSDTASYYEHATCNSSNKTECWAKASFWVYADVTDNSGRGIKEIRTCAHTDTCDATTGTVLSSGTRVSRDMTTDGVLRVCVYVVDNSGKTSSECSDVYKLDTTKPTAGTILVNNESPSSNWYTENLTITTVNGSDSLSGHLSTSVDVTSITEDTEGKVVTVTTKDKAGNTSTRSYTLKLDKTEPSVTITKGDNTTTLTSSVTPSTTESNYTYQWYKGSSAITNATSSTYTPSEAGTYKVVVTTGANKTATSNTITINSYTVSYNLNGGTSASIPSQTKVEDISLTLSSATPTRSGYDFMGWGVSANDTTKDYDKGSTYTSNSNIELFAIWKKTVTVTYVANGATLTGSTSVTCDMYNADTSCSVSTPTISRSGFDIVGFNTDSTATTKQADSNSTASVSSNTTYYAITKKDVTVTFYRNGAASITPSGGSASTANSITQTCTIKNTATSCSITSPTITASSNTPDVVGWGASADAQASVWTPAQATTFTSNASYYAVTKKDAVTYTVSYNGNGATSGSTASQTCTIPTSYNGVAQSPSCSVTLNGSGFAKTGYTFQGWSSNSGASSPSHKSGDAYIVSGNTTLYAIYSVNSYTCSAGEYLGSGATSCTLCEAGSYCSGGTYNYSSSVQGKATCPSGYTSGAGASSAGNCYLTTTAGYYIASANTSSQTTCPSGYYCPSSTVYYGNTGGIAACPSGYGASAAGSTASSHCYNTITVSYSGNGATSGSTASQSCNAYYGNGSCSITLSGNGFEKTGYNFQGWGTGTSSVTHNVGTSYSFSSNVTLNAIWKVAFSFKVGDYIKMTPTITSVDIDLSYMSSSSTLNPSELNVWRVIKVNDDNTVDAVSQYVSSVKLSVSSNGYHYYLSSINTVASKYANSTYTSATRGITADDADLIKSVFGTLVAYRVDAKSTAAQYLLADCDYTYDNSTHDQSYWIKRVDTDGTISDAVLYSISGDTTTSGTKRGYMRPIVTFKAGLSVASGSGTVANPYVLE